MKKSVLILMALFTVAIGYSQTFTDANFIEYTVIPGTNTVEVTDYDFANGGSDVAIPATVDNATTTYSVTSIKYLAFQNNGLTSVIIPNSVISIGTGAFSDNALITAVIGNSVMSIGTGAFQNNQLASVIIPDSVTSISGNAFINNQLISVILGSGVLSIGNSAFQSNQLTSVTIPSNVTSIGDFTFINNPLLACVVSEATTPPTITTGGSDTFFNLRSNIDLSIPSGTASAYATAQWTGFHSVSEGLAGTFVVDNITYQINASPNNEVTVTDYNTAGGTVVNIPATVSSGCTDFSVTDIGISAFVANQLTSVTIPSSVINIGTAAFAQNQLVSVVIPDSVLTLALILMQPTKAVHDSYFSNIGERINTFYASI